MNRFVVIVVLTALGPLAAAGQKFTRPDPADPAAVVPPVRYESAFAGYSPYSDAPLAPWRDVNEEVARAGGHVGIFGGAGKAGHATKKPAAKSPAARPAPDAKPAPQAGHGAAHK